MLSFPPWPTTVSPPASALMLSLPAVPAMKSGPFVPVIFAATATAQNAIAMPRTVGTSNFRAMVRLRASGFMTIERSSAPHSGGAEQIDLVHVVAVGVDDV